ncbi:hypothetical protein KIN20_006827 [Parelaphostrongylus tenuis]|uniref:Uncharacterized protein n=1 Tax=Parelaphostrongylus tenuis TaxID=148309 RepID=A0AAD5M2D3_PARTN|nr:hypothetical protein KIN20_006827 [Parelaphostrongylus tenuis]
MIGFAQSALNQTEIEIRLSCSDYDSDMTFQVQYVLRSSPCDKEFFDARRAENLRKLLTFYFDDLDHMPDTYDYDKTEKSRRKGLSNRWKNQSKSSDTRLHFGEYKPHHIVDNMKIFPKFRRRSREGSQLLSIDLRTLNGDNDKFDWNELPTSEDSQQKPTADSSKESDLKSTQLLEEIVALETMMTNLEQKVKEAYNGTIHGEGTTPSTTDLSTQKIDQSVYNSLNAHESSFFTKKKYQKVFLLWLVIPIE